MSNDQLSKTKYDLQERTARFGENIIKFAKKIPENSITRPIIVQIVKSGTSVGANYCEADNAASKRDFKHKIGICKKEAREAMHWLKMTIVAVPTLSLEANILWAEAKELNLIFNAIVISANKDKN